MDVLKEVININSSDFFQLFNLHQGIDFEDKYLFDDTLNETGFSLVRKYPQGVGFLPTKNNKGEDDDVILIKVFLIKEKRLENIIPVGLSISKASKYRLKDYPNGLFLDVNKNNPDSPNAESLTLSAKSKQPINLEDVKTFSFDTATKTFYKLENKKKIDPKEIINNIYNDHIRTYNSLGGLFLKINIYINESLVNLSSSFGDFLLKVENLIGVKRHNASKFFDIFWGERQERNYKPQEDPRHKEDRTVKGAILPQTEPLLQVSSFQDLKLHPYIFIPVSLFTLYLFWIPTHKNSYLAENKVLLDLSKMLSDYGQNVVFTTAIITLFLLLGNYTKPAIVHLFKTTIKTITSILIWICVFIYKKLIFKRFELWNTKKVVIFMTALVLLELVVFSLVIGYLDYYVKALLWCYIKLIMYV